MSELQEKFYKYCRWYNPNWKHSDIKNEWDRHIQSKYITKDNADNVLREYFERIF